MALNKGIKANIQDGKSRIKRTKERKNHISVEISMYIQNKNRKDSSKKKSHL